MTILLAPMEGLLDFVLRDILYNVLTSDRFLIKHANLEKEKYRPDYDRIETETYLVQIDKKGNEILAREVFEENLPFKFEVVVDTRK